MAFKMSMTDSQGNVYPDAVWIVKEAGFSDLPPAGPKAFCVLACYKSKELHDATPYESRKIIPGELTVTATGAKTSEGLRRYEAVGEEYQYMRAAALNAQESGFDIIAASYAKALATKDVGDPPVGDAEDTRVSFFKNAEIV